MQSLNSDDAIIFQFLSDVGDDETFEDGGEVVNHHPPQQLNWEHSIETSIKYLKSRKPREPFHSRELFSKDGARYALKKGNSPTFAIFAWCIGNYFGDCRYRETLAEKKEENIDKVVDAMNFFYSEFFTDEDYQCLIEYYLENAATIRPIWTIVELKNHIEHTRAIRTQQVLQNQSEVLAQRLRAAEQIALLMLPDMIQQRNTINGDLNKMSLEQRLELLESIVLH